LLLVVRLDVCRAVEVVGEDDVGSLQPNQPGDVQLAVDEGLEAVADTDVRRGTLWVGDAAWDVDDSSSSSPSLHPNQPGVLQGVVVVGPSLLEVVVVDVVVDVVDVVVVVVVVVDSSRQPHHPGVLHVEVRVVVVLVQLVVLVVVGEGSDSWLSKYSQLKQSVQLTAARHSAGASYFSSTSFRTSLIRWLPTPLRQPKSPTVS
jgi:hypothetical protein